MAKRFKWRLETVKKAKEREKEKNQELLGRAQTALRTEETKLATLRSERDKCVQELEGSRTGRLNPANLSLSHSYLNQLDRKIQEQEKQVELARSVTEEKRGILLKTVQERKVLENLRDREHQKFKKEERRRDQAMTDETAGRRAFNNNQFE
jgi:flagellar FliJ protein